MTTIDNTLIFADENHLCVIPIRYKEKKPLVEWKEYQDRKPTKGEIRGWFESDVPRNIAFVCGSVSGGEGRALCVIDYDDLKLFNALHKDGKSRTRCAKSARGIHEYFFIPEPVGKFRLHNLWIISRQLFAMCRRKWNMEA